MTDIAVVRTFEIKCKICD